jgi:Flp pilus assembly protein TadD
VPYPPKSNLSAPLMALIVFVVMVALYGVDKFLAARETSELDQEASNHYAAGRKLLAAGQPRQAVQEFARAHAIERTNREYLLSLATAELSDHRLSDARTALDDALEEDSNDGQANLLMARLMVEDGHYKDADSYYHRAIYGEWPPNASGPAARVRLELARMLSEHGGNQELLSELLLLENEPNRDLATKKEIAGLFLRAGAAQRAAAAYRDLIREDRGDADVYVGLGQAEILEGTYHAAENAFLEAMRRRPDDPRLQSQLAMVARLTVLDPTVRRLSSAEKYRRAVAIVDLVRKELDACRPGVSPAQPDVLRGPVNNEMAEARLDQAEKLWKTREEVCQEPPAAEDPLPVLMRKLAQ